MRAAPAARFAARRRRLSSFMRQALPTLWSTVWEPPLPISQLTPCSVSSVGRGIFESSYVVSCFAELAERRSARVTLSPGSLAQRSPVTRKTIAAVCAASKRAVFDVNMRPPFVDKEVIAAGLKARDGHESTSLVISFLHWVSLTPHLPMR